MGSKGTSHRRRGTNGRTTSKLPKRPPWLPSTRAYSQTTWPSRQQMLTMCDEIEKTR